MKSELIDAARKAREGAYAPYSNFPVGAACLTDSGTVVYGCNVENASYGLGMCAERVCLGSVISEGAGVPVALAVVGSARLTPPCGACRQVIFELSPECDIFIGSPDSEASEEWTIRDLLPHAFERKHLGGEAPDESG